MRLLPENIEPDKYLGKGTRYLVYTIILILFVLIIFFNAILNKNTTTENLVSILGNTLGVFVALLIAVFTFLAFYVQYDANKKIQNQFIKQNQDTLFFRLFDAFKERTINYSINIESNAAFHEIKSYEILSHLVSKLKQTLMTDIVVFGKYLLSEYPEVIDEMYYSKLNNSQKLNQAIFQEGYGDLKMKFIDLNNYDKRWEYIKSFRFFPMQDSRESAENVFRTIGNVYWYKIDLTHRKRYYEETYNIVYKNYGGYLEGFINDLNNILLFIEEVENPEFYISIFKNGLTAHEKAIIFYFLITKDDDNQTLKLSEKHRFLDSLVEKSSFFIDSPSSDEFGRELSALFYKEVEWPIKT